MGKNTSILINLNDDNKLVNNIMDELTKANHKIVLGEINKDIYSDGETCVDYISSVRKKTVFILCSPNSAEKILQLEFAIDAARRASAKKIVPILTYFPYSRQDKKDQARGPIGAKVTAFKLEMLGASEIITIDLHADQIQGFFQIPVTHLDGRYIFGERIHSMGLENLVLVSPDVGGTKRVKHIKDLLLKKYNISVPMVVMYKNREKANQVGEMFVIGDVRGMHAIMIDDMCDTGGTLCKGAGILKQEGALSVKAIVTHPVLSGNAYLNIEDSELDLFICSDTLPLKSGEVQAKILVDSVAHQLMLAILAIDKGLSIENLKENKYYN